MKHISKRIAIIIISSIAVLIGVFIGIGISSRGASELSRSEYIPTRVLSGNSITCTYKQTMTSYYQGEFAEQHLNPAETNPIIMTFNYLNTDEPELSFIDATRTITTVPVVKINEDNTKYVLIEASEYYTTTHTIYKNKGLGVYAKSVDLLGTPAGTLAMGECI